MRTRSNSSFTMAIPILTKRLEEQLFRIGLNKAASGELVMVLFDSLRSNSKFPVPFDQAWQWLGYSTKGSGLRGLLSLRINSRPIVEGTDYQKARIPSRGAPAHDYTLSADCFRTLALTCENPRGQLVRDFFVSLSKEYSAHLAEVQEASDLMQLQASTIERASAFQATHVEVLTKELPPPVRLERLVTLRLRTLLGGHMEVGSTHGRIDILTDIEVIEVKRFKDWKTGLGQVLVYSDDYPDLRARLYLFAVAPEELTTDLQAISRLCVTRAVTVTFELVSCAELLAERPATQMLPDVTGAFEPREIKDEGMATEEPNVTDTDYAEGVISRFIDEHCIVDSSKSVTSGDFHDRLLAITNGSTEVLGMRRVWIIMHRRFRGRELKRKSRRNRGFAGICLKDASE
jgi:hypothetical protein